MEHVDANEPEADEPVVDVETDVEVDWYDGDTQIYGGSQENNEMYTQYDSDGGIFWNQEGIMY